MRYAIYLAFQCKNLLWRIMHIQLEFEILFAFGISGFHFVHPCVFSSSLRDVQVASRQC